MGTSEDVWVVDGVWWVWYCSARTHNEQRHLKYNTYLTWSVVLCWKRRKNHAVRPFVRHRIDPFAEAIRYIAQHNDVWLTTGREIAEHFYAHSYDPMVEAIAAAQA